MDKVTDTVAFVQEWLMNADYDPSQFDRDFAAAIDARVIATTAKQLAETFCATPLPDDVCADLCATVQGPGRYGTNLLTVAQAEQVFAAALATPAPDSEKLREALDRIAFLSTNHGGWFEADPWKSYAELGDIARAARGASL